MSPAHNFQQHILRNEWHMGLTLEFYQTPSMQHVGRTKKTTLKLFQQSSLYQTSCKFTIKTAFPLEGQNGHLLIYGLGVFFYQILEYICGNE